MSEKKSNVINLGCRLNAFESQGISEILAKHDINDTIVINTCAVTKEAERQSRQEARKAIKNNPGKKVIVTGCAAQINPDQFKDIEGVSLVLGNDKKNDESSYVKASFIGEHEKIKVNDIMTVKETSHQMISSFDGKSRAFIQIQNGCNHRCTFCIIPYGRGNSRSVPAGEIVRQVEKLVENGYNEVVLTGVDITDYGFGLPNDTNLGKLCKSILKMVPSLKRLRLSSIDVAEVCHELWDLIKSEPRFMPYFHISIQSGDNMILKRMKRRHSREDVIKFCNDVRKYRPECGFGSDIIVGFPTETNEMFKNTCDLIQECGIVYNHIFTYSARSGTPAAKIKQIPLEIRKERNKILTEIGQCEYSKFINRFIGSTRSIILEDKLIGRCENFLPIKIQNDISNMKIGAVYQCKIHAIDGGDLVGNII